ncbi:MAG: cysteine--tRNA ligase [Syntrophomonadaceae bacterium]|nr:cysteine--tRNA ligase [Syntrophomonadaceae bacterium]
MKIYNTLSGNKEELVTLNPQQASIYVCGPTTYNYIHLGNARPLVIFDTVRRYLKYRGYDVTYIQNFTDVDDKIINRARDEGIGALELAQKYINEYFQDADRINVLRADVHPRVSEHIPEIIAAVEGLIERGYAYVVDGDVYFRVQAFPTYGKLSGRSLEDMMAGARVEVDQRKEEAVDFALWKAAKEGEPAWDSPWGQGRPGWHIECSVMSNKYLGATFDIHGGGSDLIFPHHENEIAQAEALTGQQFVKYWMHNGFITVNNEKMSKSLGNFFILRDVLARYPADVVRFYLISTHYRSPLDFDDGKLEEARKALGRLKTSLILADEFLREKATPIQLDERAQEFLDSLQAWKESFIMAMDDDFNTAKAIGFLFEMAHGLNSYIAGADVSNLSDRSAVEQAQGIIRELGDVLGIFIENDYAETGIADSVLEILINLRQRARQEKDYATADNIRNFLSSISVSVEDTGNSSRTRYENQPDLKTLMDKILELRSSFRQGKKYSLADYIRDALLEAGIVVEDSREGARWKFVNA